MNRLILKHRVMGSYSIRFNLTAVILFIIFIYPNGKILSQTNGESLYKKFCAQCHGSDLNGGNATSLIDGIWQFGAEDGYVTRNIKFGIPHLGMPSYEKSLSDGEIRTIVDYIREGESLRGVIKPSLPDFIETMDYYMEVVTFAEGLKIPWAIDFIDKSTALITERPGRLRVVKNGVLLPEPVKNTPEVLHEGQGGLLDVAIDPDYEDNGWIYLAYSHVLSNVRQGERPPAMTRIVRGKIENNSWATEHGPMGGDELNLIESGKNYGWETITYGVNYNGTIITELTHMPGMEQPVFYWKPSIAVCGLDFYTGDLFKKWKNRLLAGALKYEEVRLLHIEKDKVIHDQVILKGAGRVRDVSTGPDGAIYVVLNKPDKVIRLTPQEN